jgi:hypothetical protein
MLLLLLLCCFHLFVDFIHNVPRHKKVANLWYTNEPKANGGIWSFTRYATLKNRDEFQYVLIPCINIMYVLQCVGKASKNELKSSVHWSNHLFLALYNQINKGNHCYTC